MIRFGPFLGSAEEEERELLVFLSGGVRSGKSALGEECAEKLATGRKIYFATALACDGEMKRRVEKHRRDRMGKHFVTLEQPQDAEQAAAFLRPGDTVLLDCLGNLTANEMFRGGAPYDPKRREALIRKIFSGLCAVKGACENLIVISNDVFSGGDRGGTELSDYQEILGRLHVLLAERADLAAECVCGIPVYRRGGPEREKTEPENAGKSGGENMCFVFGGKSQGKLAYAEKLAGGDPAVCDLAAVPPQEMFSADVIVNVQDAVGALLRQGADALDFFRRNAGRLRGKVLVGDEIGCGIVPVDAFERRWRDETGRVYQFLAAEADRVDRVWAGIGVTLKP